MDNYAVICEYNPFHTGHRHQLQKAREDGADNILCVMSGNFVQSAMPAFCDKAIRAECAVTGGADAVIELPALYATASAGYFAEGGLKIIAEIKDIKKLIMGATADKDTILRCSELKIKKHDAYKALLDKYLDAGKSYNTASTAALNELYLSVYPENGGIDGVLAEPNNMLCIEYIAAIDKLAPHIQPLIIKRAGQSHNSDAITGEHISATTIRNAVQNGNADAIKAYVPYLCDEILDFYRRHSPDISAYKKAALLALKRTDKQKMRNYRNCSEGMEYMLEGNKISDYDRLIESAVTRRYGKKRIARLMLDCLLDIDRALFDCAFCTRLLAVRSGFDFSILPNNVKTTNAELKAAKKTVDVARVLAVDEGASALYNTLTGIDGDYYNYSLVKV